MWEEASIPGEASAMSDGFYHNINTSTIHLKINCRKSEYIQMAMFVKMTRLHDY